MSAQKLVPITPGWLLKVEGPQSWPDGLIRNRDGNPKPVLANAITALRNAPELNGVLAFNEFSLRVVTQKPPPWGAAIGDWTDQDDRLTADWLQHQGILVGIRDASEATQTVARERPFHPVRNYLGSIKWDGTRRADQWLALYFGVDNTDYARAVGLRWMVSAVARVDEPGCKADCCLILERHQGIGKSRGLKAIAGEWFTDEIADLGTKDAAMQAAGVWIVELSELDSLTRAEATRIKAFMSRSTDRFRPPYGRRVIDAPRQCVFAGTCNQDTYLKDETGGRRFWPVRCGRIDLESLARDRDQLWAEVMQHYREGVPWWLDSRELTNEASEQQSARYSGDPWDDVIAAWLSSRESVSIAEVLTLCINKTKEQWTQSDLNRVARCLRAAGWERFQRREASGREWRYRRPTPC